MRKKSYSAFTLIEMLVVMGILVILGALSFSTYQDMQTTIRMNEYATVLEENIRKAQRDAMLLKRQPNEGWIYGIGITFIPVRGISEASTSTVGGYRVFKWCAEVEDYGDGNTEAEVPGYDGSGAKINALLSREFKGGLCSSAYSGDSPIKSMSGYDLGLLPPKGSTEQYEEIEGKKPRTILFESVTGKAFFYNEKNEVLNYSIAADGTITPDENPISFVLSIARPGSGKAGKKITVAPTSGKITVEGLK